ncbi:MAG: hypothetical protein SCARUB_00562 [Candidatus Scalindua rubra]|uniref:DUF8196 domain-containing protein n=1 Tax=Candidatus Scalindua rubra TaxID=1872076 RepID=A0A1E3XF95_9BACT|nr:MAG: hypothetical protein SCARUB_00562 [Candidatus Scalindua rubra]
MYKLSEIKEKLEKVFDKKQANVLTDVIVDAYGDLVKSSDFNELKTIVKELAEAQKRTEVRIEELAEAQKETEKEIRLLAIGLDETRGEIGGLSRSVSYGFENEAYRMLPNVLKKNYGIELREKLIRKEIGGEEINIFGKAKKDGRDVLIVGEVKLRLDDRRMKRKEGDIFKRLDEKVTTVMEEYKGKMEEYKGKEVVRVLITHFATRGFMKKAKESGVIVVQSFEW